jgi:pimeloyl-ACP methyl ester carboxylesterase
LDVQKKVSDPFAMSFPAAQARSADARERVHTIHYHLSYIRHGSLTSTTQPVVIFLHDFPGDASQWSGVLAALDARPGLAFDLLGYGQSDRPWPADTSVWGHADALNLALRELRIQSAIFVGVGLGGGVAQILATRLAPDLTRGLVLIDSLAYQYSFHPDWPLPEMEKRQDPEAPLHAKIDDVEVDLRKTIPLGSANPATISGVVLDASVQLWLSPLGIEMLYQQIRNLVPSYLNAVGSDLHFISCPTLIVWGERDTIVPVKLATRLQHAIPGSRLEIVPGAGHLILNDAPDAVARLVTGFVAQIRS